MFRFRLALSLGILLALASFSTGAKADWFSGFSNLFGLLGDSDQPPAPRADAVSYALDIQISDDSLLGAMQDSSNLYRLRQQPPQNGEELARRAAGDLPRLVDALWAEGYYDASARAFIEGQAIGMSSAGPGGPGLDAAAAAADRLRGKKVVQVRLAINPAQLYTIGKLEVRNARGGGLVDPDISAPRVIKLAPGDPARANAVRAMQARVIDALRAQSYPLAKIDRVVATVMHPERQLDVVVFVDSGPRAGFGDVTVTGTRNLDPAVVRSFIYIEPGDPYSPERLAATRKSLAQVEIIGSARILESDHLDASGNLPITVQIDERKQHAVSAAAQFSSLDGPSLQADWTDRNMFGGGERLRLASIIGMSSETGGRNFRGLLNPNRLDGRVGASFIKPALWGSRNDFISDVTLTREVTNSYTADYLNGQAGVRHRFSESFSIQGSAEAERGRSLDPFHPSEYYYTLVGVNGALRYDDTDNLLDPTRGFRVLASAAAYPRFLGSTIDLYQAKGSASTYYAIDDEARYILAGRLGLGAMGGAPLEDIPENRRFFAGGGGSVRGYAYRSLSPMVNNVAVGGSSLLEASAEIRIKITDTIGVVPFFDSGSAFDAAYPDFKQPLRYAAGLGLRYYTGFGPIRLDVAAPIARRSGEAPLAFYIGIGQAY